MPLYITAFPDYVKSGKDDGTNAFVHRIHQRVVELNCDKRFVRRGMTLERISGKYSLSGKQVEQYLR